EPQRHDSQIVTTETQDRKAQQVTENACHNPCQRQGLPETPACPVIKQCIGVGTYRIEADEAEVQQACKADHNVQAEPEHHVNENQGCNIDFCATGEEGPDQRNSNQQCDGCPAGRIVQNWQADATGATRDGLCKHRPYERLEHKDDGHAQQYQ